ncbi:hypothetical protein [Methylobacterium platani]|uniref:hypothetical protein n=1 Tax=Methylobacterium platani TaxID=427683 RepID=UPI0012E2195F|nr:hypothetical protein [Methylobacterium platani]
MLRHLERIADPADLPVVIAAIAGRRVFIPRTPTRGNIFCRALGADKGIELVRRLNADEPYGCEIDVPLAETGAAEIRRRMIRQGIIESSKNGINTTDTAMKLGITRRRVQQLRRQLIDEGTLSEEDARRSGNGRCKSDRPK